MALNVATVAQIILMARELDRAEPELRAFVENLTVDEQREIVALMWIGRGAFESDEWDEAIATATREATVPTVDYLIGTPHLSDHLESGLDVMGRSATQAEDDLIRGG